MVKASEPEPGADAVPNAEQSKHWNEAAGQTWVALADRIGGQLRPLGLRALARADLAEGHAVLDVGCGGGETTIALARIVGPRGSVLGVDISKAMIASARAAAGAAGARNVAFELADAQTAALPERAFDRLFSRFGVMFFDDPLAAFRQIRRALRDDARLAFVCWRGLDENPLMSVPLAAVQKHVTVQRPEPGAPGPMAFADPARVRAILEGAGFTEVAFEAVDEVVGVGGGLVDLDEAVTFLTTIGPGGSALRDADPAVRAAVSASLREALAPYHGVTGVRMPAACWVVTAVNR